MQKPPGGGKGSPVPTIGRDLGSRMRCRWVSRKGRNEVVGELERREGRLGVLALEDLEGNFNFILILGGTLTG